MYYENKPHNMNFMLFHLVGFLVPKTSTKSEPLKPNHPTISGGKR